MRDDRLHVHSTSPWQIADCKAGAGTGSPLSHRSERAVWQASGMSIEGSLWVGPVLVNRLLNGVGDELIAVFRDDMMESAVIPKHAEYVESIKFRASGPHVAARLDLMGLTPELVYEHLNRHFERVKVRDARTLSVFKDVLAQESRDRIERDIPFLASFTAQDWVEGLADAPEDEPEISDRAIRSRTWFVDHLYTWDERLALRAALLSFPDSEVILEVAHLEGARFVEAAQRSTVASSAVRLLDGMSGMHTPVIVLTEGRTDAEFLKAGLDILYPYLSDLIRFLDYDQKAEGGAGALVRMVRAFGAAGIVNRVVAMFDNDTAAADAMRVLDFEKLPIHIQVRTYPRIEVAELYPTIGPPVGLSPGGSIALADVNGLAGSIEMYLGRDVLRDSEGELRPVQWKSYISAVGRYQGEILDKAGIHASFREKCRLAVSRPDVISHQDWDGIRLIIDTIRKAAQSAFPLKWVWLPRLGSTWQQD